MGIKQRAASQNAPTTSRLALVEDAATNVFVEPIVPAGQYIQICIARKEIFEHLGASVFCVRTPLIERLQCLDNEASNGKYSKAVLTLRFFDRLKVTLVESLNEELTERFAITGCLQLLVARNRR